ncbi:hypothetical protein [Parathalassolituus penaei]|uniref:Uncharacterized protein n=1 Tax=Parathalassolituus penaei TaxID=2997323 RepID=A0A9X3EB53_9GAMM|nr:hypothetical protein [Parathalassolituus penaei]MCY0963604.1 hypothetical protein [Parathalassolituus penaei]
MPVLWAWPDGSGISRAVWLWLLGLMLMLMAMPMQAECRDLDAMAASDKLAKGYFKDGAVFHPARVLKVHSPSGRKEIASYVKTGDKRYSIFTLVDEDCKARFMKRTRQQD